MRIPRTAALLAVTPQILETGNGQLTIHKFVAQTLTKAQTSDTTNLQRRRTQLGAPQNWNL